MTDWTLDPEGIYSLDKLYLEEEVLKQRIPYKASD